MGYNVAIDGPAGAGKSTIAKLVAKEKGYIYVDTGAMYRGLAIHFLDKGIQPQETEKVIEACKDAEVTIAYEDAVQHVYLNGKDISSRLRNEEVGNMASVTSAEMCCDVLWIKESDIRICNMSEDSDKDHKCNNVCSRNSEINYSHKDQEDCSDHDCDHGCLTDCSRNSTDQHIHRIHCITCF